MGDCERDTEISGACLDTMLAKIILLLGFIASSCTALIVTPAVSQNAVASSAARAAPTMQLFGKKAVAKKVVKKVVKKAVKKPASKSAPTTSDSPLKELFALPVVGGAKFEKSLLEK